MHNPLKPTELVLNEDNKPYHIECDGNDLAETIILVGDPGRVDTVSSFFDRIHFENQHREFKARTGEFNGKSISVLSTGIGPDNIDIVLNELDAGFNVNLEQRTLKTDPTKLTLVRLGTSGALHEDIEVDSFVASSHGLGFDNVMSFYRREADRESEAIESAFQNHTHLSDLNIYPYIAKGSDFLLAKLGFELTQGITATAPGFYGPQGRSIRLEPSKPNLNELLSSFVYNGLRVSNFEMETSALYGLSGLLGHEALTICAIIANRKKRMFSQDYKAAVRNLIELTLNRLTA